MNIKEALKSNSSFTISTDGKIELVKPKDNKYFSLEEMQSFVGGLIEIIYIYEPVEMIMVLNEEGKLEDLPVNPIATGIALNGISDIIVGNVLMCKMNEME